MAQAVALAQIDELVYFRNWEPLGEASPGTAGLLVIRSHCSSTIMLTHTLKSFSSGGFQQLNRNCQVILAECLDRGTPEVMLSDTDVNADLLLRTGWLVEQCNMIAKARSFAIPHDRWALLTNMKPQLLSPGMHAEIARYRSLKPDFFKRNI